MSLQPKDSSRPGTCNGLWVESEDCAADRAMLGHGAPVESPVKSISFDGSHEHLRSSAGQLSSGVPWRQAPRSPSRENTRLAVWGHVALLKRRTLPLIEGWLVSREPFKGPQHRWLRERATPEGYAAYRMQIEHEDDLIGVRNGWLIGGEAFLFAAYAALLALPEGATRRFAEAAAVLYWELPIIGVVMALLVFCSVCAALVRSDQLRHRFDRTYKSPEGFPEIMSGRPRAIGHFVSRFIPIFFALSWVVAYSLR